MNKNKSAISVLLLIGLSFLWTGSAYLSWFYHILDFVSSVKADFLTEVIGYLFQAQGIFLFAVYLRKQSVRHLSCLILADFFISILACFSRTFMLVLVFGYLMNILHGVIAGIYLEYLVIFSSAKYRCFLFGTGYSIGCIGSWILSLPGEASFLQDYRVFIVYAICMLLTLVPLYRLPLCASSSTDTVSSSGNTTSLLLTTAGITILLLSITKNLGFYFPSADLTNGNINLEFSRVFYSFGLILAGYLNDRFPVYGAQLCISALFFPFAMLILRDQQALSWILWILNYCFFGFFTVYRVKVFTDLSKQHDTLLYLAGFGLMFGRIGDALGSALGIALRSNLTPLLVVAGLSFILTLSLFFPFYRKLYFPVPDIVPLPAEPVNETTAAPVPDNPAAHFPLTPREKDVFSMLVQGHTNSEIAATLFISENTVKFHVKNILKKTGCANRIELITFLKT